MTDQNHSSRRADKPLIDDPRAAMERLKDATRRILAVSKSEVPKHVPTPRQKTQRPKK